MGKFAAAVIAMLVMSASAGLCAPKTGLPDFVIPDCLGVNIHFTGPEQKQVDQLADGGLKFVRIDCFWGDVETKRGEYDFTRWDELKRTLDTRGVRALFILCYNNKLYDDNQAPHTDEGRAAYAKFAKEAAGHFKGQGILWEIWNEPNGSNFWHPEANVEDYVKLAKLAYPALKEGDPDCTVLAPALAGWDFGYLENAFKLGLLECTDVVSVHPYGAPKPEEVSRCVDTIKSLIKQYAPKGKEMPIVSGEWGYSAINDMTVEKQGQYLARMFLSNIMNDIRLSIWYDWRDDGPDPKENEHHFGTVYLDLKEKPAYIAAKTLTKELSGYSYACCVRIDGASDEDYFALFKNGDDYRMAAWTTGKNHTVHIPLDVKNVEIVSFTGERRQVEVKNDMLDLELSGGVQYIEPTEQSRRWAAEAGWKVWTEAVSGSSRGVSVVSSTTNTGGEVSASGEGMKPISAKISSDSAMPNAPVVTRLDSKYVWSGETRAKVTVTLNVGLSKPLVRVVEVDTSAYPRVQVLPPASKELLFAVSRPLSGLKDGYKGKLVIGNTEGIRPVKDFVDFEILPGQDRVIVRLPLTQIPAAMFSYASRLLDEQGNDVLRMHTRRCSVLETFAVGKPGERVPRFEAGTDGDPKVRGEAQLTYSKASSGGAESICAKLTYNVDMGWRYIYIASRPMIPVYEKPSHVVIWIKGDASQAIARARFVDGGNQTFQPDYGRIDFQGWQCMEADLSGKSAGHWGGKNDGSVSYPIKLDSLFLIDSMSRKMSGSVYIGPIMLCYD